MMVAGEGGVGGSRRGRCGGASACALVSLLLLLAGTGADAQSATRPDAVMYVAAIGFLAGLRPVSVGREYHCRAEWLHAYGLPVRCMKPTGRTSLRLVAEALDVPLVEELPPCGDESADEPHGRSLRLSPVQLDTADTAWFVAASACRRDRVEIERLDLVELGLADGAWSVRRTTPLGGG